MTVLKTLIKLMKYICSVLKQRIVTVTVFKSPYCINCYKIPIIFLLFFCLYLLSTLL